MPARDFHHDAVRNALIKDGWTITDDPLRLEYEGRRLFVDLGAERLIGAEKQNRKIAVEVKSFVGPSEMADLHIAVGQFITYHDILERVDPARELFLADPIEVVICLFDEPFGRVLVENRRVALVGFDLGSEEVVRWIS